MIDINKVKMIKNKVLIKKNALEDIVLNSGIIITKGVQQRTNNGVVLSVGPKAKSVNVGDHVCFVNLIWDISADYVVVLDKDVILKWS